MAAASSTGLNSLQGLASLAGPLPWGKSWLHYDRDVKATNRIVSFKDGLPAPGVRLERKREQDMAEKKGNQKIIGVRGRLYLLALLAIVFTAVPILTTEAEGSTQCPVPQKGGNAMKQPKPNVVLPRGLRPPIDLIVPVGTETATFALG
jgi:hypothetical protein